MSPCRPAPARPVHRRHSGPNPQENAAAAQGVVPRQLEFRRNAYIINSLQKTGVQVGSKALDGSLGSFSEKGFELGEEVFDWIEVGIVKGERNVVVFHGI